MAIGSKDTQRQRRFGFLVGLLAAFALLNPLPAVAKYAAIIVDADTGKVLHEANADTRNYPASLTKMMTLYMLFDAIEQGQMTLDTRLKVSKRAAGMAPSKLGLAPGSTIRVRDAIQALVTKSANDVAAVVAENLAGGSEIRFARNMTNKARALGMRNTTFKNASGLPNKGQLSSARDMAILSQRLMKDFPQHYHYFSIANFSYAGRVYRSHNNLNASYAGADGIKTGYTVASGFNLATSAKRNNRRLIGVVLGGKTARSRDAHMANLLDNGFAKLNGQPEMLVAAPLLYDPPSNGDHMDVAVGDIDEATFPEPRLERKPVSQARKVQLDFTWGIQVGAYGSRDRAMEQANIALSRLMTLYPNADVRVQPTKDKKGRTLYRAQVVGLTQSDTKLACDAAAIQTKVACHAVAPLKTLKVSRR